VRFIAEALWSGNSAAFWFGMGPAGLIFGNNIFDAVRGAPGTYLTLDYRGHLGFGFDESLWSVTHNFIDNAKAKTPPGVLFDPGAAFQVIVQDFGASDTVEGLIPDLIAAQTEEARLANIFAKVSVAGHSFQGVNVSAAGNLLNLLNGAFRVSPDLWSAVILWAGQEFPEVGKQLPYLIQLQNQMTNNVNRLNTLFVPRP
jgi:hypothetical protein